MASVSPRGFLPGEKVAVFPRIGGGSLLPGTAPLQKAVKKVDSNGEVSFTGLEEGQQVFVAREDGSSAIAMTAKNEQPAQRNKPQKEIAELLTGTRPHQPQRTVVEGARTTASRGGLGQPFVNPESGSPTPSGIPIEPGHPRQEDFRSVPQRAVSVTGRAEPVAGAPQAEAVPQSDARRIEQASATELGVAVPRDPKADPAERVRQEDARRTRQRAVGDTGEATPVDDPPARTKTASPESGQRTVKSSSGSRTVSRSRASQPNQSGKARAPKAAPREGAAAKSARKTSSKQSRSGGRKR